jgi:hypothetical protein
MVVVEGNLKRESRIPRSRHVVISSETMMFFKTKRKEKYLRVRLKKGEVRRYVKDHMRVSKVRPSRQCVLQTDWATYSRAEKATHVVKFWDERERWTVEMRYLVFSSSTSYHLYMSDTCP